jgi:hypothetical protein
MKSNARYLSLYLTALAGFIITGCGESLSNAELMSTLQMQTEPCTATFNQDHEVIDFWGDSLFTIKSGETYILADLYERGTTTEASFYYLVEEGAYGFELEVEGSDVSEFPFDLSCTNGTSSVLGVFSDVVVYSDEGLNEEVCRMNRGSSAPIDSVSGYSLVSGLFESPAVYKVELAGFSELCGGLTEGYVEAPSASVLGTSTVLVPIRRYAAPAAG